jgi:hypothetical protein
MLGLTWFHPRSDGQHRTTHTDCSVKFNDPEIDGRIRILVLMIGLEVDVLRDSVASQAATLRSRGREPIFVTDQPCIEVFREQNVVVEILPGAAMLRESDHARYEIYIAGKLESIRESWLISEEVCVGQPVETLYAPPNLDPIDTVA